MFGIIDTIFTLDVSSIVESQFLVMSWINDQKKFPAYFKIVLNNFTLLYDDTITMDNFEFYDLQEYLNSILVKV